MNCLWKARKPRTIHMFKKKCLECGKGFEVKRYRLATAGFCSKRCSAIAYAGHRSEAQLKAVTKHGFAKRSFGKKTPEYRTWGGMKARCAKGLYAELGIKVCERWENSFMAFYEDMGPKPSSKHTIDRYPNAKGDYCPENCRWATKKEQGWSKIGKRASIETREKMSKAQRARFAQMVGI